MADEVVTHDEVLRWLSLDVQHELLMALNPEQRGWYTEEEAAQTDGRFVEAISFDHREVQLFRTDRRG